MLTSLSIKNYALIDELYVDFNNGLSIITGETGAGKSILLGGLSLVLGKRADLSSLKNKDTKCIIEATFNIQNYSLEKLFKEEDLDFENNTIIRREILPSGKSRAFVNDTPVNLNSLQILGSQLVDIHSQYQTLQLVSDDFQFKVIDALANNKEKLVAYSSVLSNYKLKNKELEELLNFKSEAIKEHDYNSFLLKELVDANLVEDELEALEEEYETLNNIEDIQEKLSQAYQLLSDEQVGVLSTLTELKHTTQKLSNISSQYNPIFERINSGLIELDDVFTEVENLQEQIEANPERLEQVNTKLTTINNLFKKHVVSSVPELIKIKEELEEKVSVTENLDDTISEKENELDTLRLQLEEASKVIHKSRKSIIPALIDQLESILSSLGMPNAKFKVELEYSDTFLSNGKDNLQFYFSANKGGELNTLKKAASGGELSRIMLAIKSILSKYMQLPTIMFDEIDTGVSGEVSNKIADIMQQMSKYMQVFAITHLPQIAAKGHTHFKVYKEEKGDATNTNLIKLNHDDRIVEIAQMLGGTKISSSAIAHAKELLN